MKVNYKNQKNIPQIHTYSKKFCIFAKDLKRQDYGFEIISYRNTNFRANP